VEIDRPVPIRVEERPKAGVMGLLAALIHRSFTIFIDCALLCLLGIADGHVGGLFNRSMPLKHLVVIFSFIAGVRGVVTWMRRGLRPMSHRRLARATPLGGPSFILPVLGPLLMTRAHPEIRDME
jgi:hypothetical protein